MAADSKIEWCNHTFNAWSGCTKVSDGCKHCYAEALMDTRYGKTKWGPRGLRVIKADSGWREPAKWNRLAVAAGEVHRVFCASLADMGEGPETMPAESWEPVQAARRRLVDTFTPLTNLVPLLLTKRPENMPKYWPADFLARCYVGTSVENQAAADERIPHLSRCPAAVRFLSCEPLLGPLELRRFLSPTVTPSSWPGYGFLNANARVGDNFRHRIDWVIVGGESGPKARPFNVEWARSIVEQCKAAGVACFVKQLGTVPVEPNSGDDMEYVDTGGTIALRLRDRKGGDMDEWDEDLRVREFPARPDQAKAGRGKR